MTTDRDRATFDDLNPATGQVLAQIASATSSEVAARVSEARAAQAAWRAQPLSERLECLRRIAARIRESDRELATLCTQEMGKPLRDAIAEVRGHASHIGDVLKEVEVALEPREFAGGGADTVLVWEPHGVVAAITPWNFPVGMPLSILVPALATGNTVVFKPSEHVPLLGARLAELFQAELPEGVLTLLQGAGEVGAQLVASDVEMIGFVGSRATGQKIMASASRGLKRLVLELGGKDPMVVFGDADLEEAAECAVRHSLRNTGQVCCSVERIYVAEDVAAAFEHRVVEKTRAWTHGDGFRDGVSMGPMVSAEQRAKVERQVDDAVAGGARLLIGGKADSGPGYFYPATVLAGVTDEHALARDETFGPIVSLSTFDGSEERAIELANDTPYGLGANVWTADRSRGERVAHSIRAGQVGVNRYLLAAKGTPWVGARQSGFGFLGGVEGHRQFTVPKSISIASSRPENDG